MEVGLTLIDLSTTVLVLREEGAFGDVAAHLNIRMFSTLDKSEKENHSIGKSFLSRLMVQLQCVD